MCSADWFSVISETNVDNAAENFMNIILPIVDLHASYKTINSREKGADWSTADFLSLIDDREFRTKCFDQSPTDLNAYLKKEAMKEVNRAKRNLQRNYINEHLLCHPCMFSCGWTIHTFPRIAHYRHSIEMISHQRVLA